MWFPISGEHLDPVYLILVGFVVGLLGGFFGVGGSFLAGPALFSAGLPMNFVVGTDLAHIVGKSIVAARRHQLLGNVDLKLGAIMVFGTIAGVETGAQIIQFLKRRMNIDWVVGIGFIIVLLSISTVMGWESIKTLQHKRRGRKMTSAPKATGSSPLDESAFPHLGIAQRFRLPPMIRLPASGIEQISLWAILLVGYVGGVLSGFLGGGAGYVRMPSLVYFLGVPTHVAVGTDLFEIMISAGYGTISHALKGNVDILIALVMHTGAAIGAQLGAMATSFFGGPRIRLAFVPLPLLGAGLLIYSLLTGHPAK